MADASDAVRLVVEAHVSAALARCAREGIAVEDFWVAMSAEDALGINDGLPMLLARTFRRLKAGSN